MKQNHWDNEIIKIAGNLIQEKVKRDTRGEHGNVVFLLFISKEMLTSRPWDLYIILSYKRTKVLESISKFQQNSEVEKRTICYNETHTTRRPVSEELLVFLLSSLISLAFFKLFLHSNKKNNNRKTMYALNRNAFPFPYIPKIRYFSLTIWQPLLSLPQTKFYVLYNLTSLLNFFESHFSLCTEK